MEFLRNKIKEEGKVINPTTLKVDSFLNHQLDPQLMLEMGKEFKKRFEGKGINKILTIEASGIAIGIMAGLAFDVPVVFAKKKKPSTGKPALWWAGPPRSSRRSLPTSAR